MNKNLALLFASACAVLSGTGCIRTTHEIKPIHITMDVNLKVDEDLDKAFGKNGGADAYERREAFKAREAKISELKSRGIVGEKPDGTIGFVVKDVPAGDAELVAEENAARRRIYALVASKRSMSAEQVGERHAERIKERAQEGELFMDSDGNWVPAN